MALSMVLVRLLHIRALSLPKGCLSPDHPACAEIDITITDALKRPFQCATIQLDFQLPVQFKLTYRTAETLSGDKTEAADDKKDLEADRARPVMIHRAILGSLERFIAIITEHFGGKWYVLTKVRCNVG